MKRIGIKCGIMAAAVCLTLVSCDKADSIPVADNPVTADSRAGIDYGVPFTEVLSVAKDYYEVGESGRVYTAAECLYSKVHNQVMLTKCSERNMSSFSLEVTDSELVMTVRRVKVSTVSVKLKPEISTADPEELTKWIVEATMAGYDVYICYDKDTGMWNGHIIKE